jgi:integrase
MLQQSTILQEDGQWMPYVFTSGGKRVRSIRRSFEMAWRRAGISGVWCHDLRHTFATNMRRAGVDYVRIMAMTGHRTMEVFMLYHRSTRRISTRLSCNWTPLWTPRPHRLQTCFVTH